MLDGQFIGMCRALKAIIKSHESLMESTKGFILDRQTKLCLYVICSFLDVENSFTSEKNYCYWMMMMIDFDSCVRQHPMWPSYEESIDNLPSMKK